jgi:nucleoside-diphosphate-sugar epimerase
MVLVTGGTGLLGSHLILQLLQANVTVRATYRSEASLEEARLLFSHYEGKEAETLFEQIRWVKADIKDVPALDKAFEGISMVYHTAAMISFNPAAWDALKKTNVEGTANIVNLCLAHKVKKLCYASSIAAIGKGPEGAEVTEENEWNESEISVYALSKHLAEMEVWRGSQEGLDIAIVNPGIILGPGNWDHGSLRLFKNVAKGMRYFPPGGTGFVSASDVARIMFLLGSGNIQNERFIVVSDNLSFEAVFAMISSSFGTKPPAMEIPMWILELGWRLDWLLHILLRKKRGITRDTVKSMGSRRKYSVQKLKGILNFEFNELENCIALSSEYFKKRYPAKFN